MLCVLQGETQPQMKRKGKAKAGVKDGWPANQTTTADSGSEVSTSRGGGGHSAPSSGGTHVCITVQVPPPSVESASGAQSTGRPAQAAACTKEERERQRKERQRQRKIDQAKEMLNVAMEVMEQSGVRCVSVLGLCETA